MQAPVTTPRRGSLQRRAIRCLPRSGDLDADGRRRPGHGAREGREAAAAGVTTHDLRRTFISHLIVGLGLDPVRVSKVAGHSNVSVTLNTYADEFDKAQHKDDLMARIERAGFGSA